MDSGARDVRKWLESIEMLSERIEQDEEQLIRLRSRLTSFPIDYTQEKVKTSIKRSNALEQMIDLEEEILMEKANLSERIWDITQTIRKTSDAVVEGVLYDKFVSGLTYRQIAEKRNYSYDYVRRLTKRGIKEIERLQDRK